MTRLLLIASLILSSLAQPSATVGSSLSQNSTGDDWRRMVLPDEEFSVLVPAEPTALDQPEGYKFSDGGERVLSQRAYSAYADGFIFAVESYRAARPQRLLKDINRLFQRFSRVQLDTSAEQNFAGLNATKYALGPSSFTGNVYVFAGREHVYAITVAAKTPGHPSLNRFLSSFSLGPNTLTGAVTPRVQDESLAAVPAPGTLVSTKEVSTKPIIVWKPEPHYTEAARQDQVTGTIMLRGTFTASGQVVITEVIKPLKDGLTEKAIAAAKNIKFFPAEKDGQPVSVSLQLQYNFNLY